MGFGEMIREARERKGWSQAEVAEMLGLTDASVSRWETELFKPPLKRVGPLADLLGIDRLAFMTALGYSLPVPRLNRLNRPALVDALFALTPEALDVVERVVLALRDAPGNQEPPSSPRRRTGNGGGS